MLRVFILLLGPMITSALLVWFGWKAILVCGGVALLSLLSMRHDDASSDAADAARFAP